MKVSNTAVTATGGL